MGFNNHGAEDAVNRLKKKKSNMIVGGNIGKNKVTPNEEAIKDYIKAFHILFPYVDYFAINISSPNTPNLRELQDKEPLQNLLNTLQTENQKTGNPKPILLKIAPDLSNNQLDDIIEIVTASKTSGIIATNTTIERNGLSYPKDFIETIGSGGLSGKPLKDRSTEVIRYIVQKTNSQIPVIGVGGIMNPEDAIEKLKAGASLVQIYTGFIYEGPSLVKKINRKILKYKI